MSGANPGGVTAQGEANCAWSILNTANNVNFLVLAKTTAQAKLPAGDRWRVRLIAASSCVKLLHISFGIALGGILYAKNIHPFTTF